MMSQVLIFAKEIRPLGRFDFYVLLCFEGGLLFLLSLLEVVFASSWELVELLVPVDLVYECHPRWNFAVTSLGERFPASSLATWDQPRPS
jgi:hypothetical protein